jgi:RNA polymerase sigma-70 factor (ECF subfamily)
MIVTLVSLPTNSGAASKPQDDERERYILYLYDSYAAKLQSYAFTLVRDDTIAQDAVQEVFLRYALMVRDGRPIARPGAWLFRVLRNYIFDCRKTAQFRNEIGMEEMPDRPDERENPEQQYASAELSRRILNSLTPRELECLRLRARGLRYHEIASVLSIRPGTVAALLFRCNTRIQQMLGPQRAAADPLPVAVKDPHAS